MKKIYLLTVYILAFPALIQSAATAYPELSKTVCTIKCADEIVEVTENQLKHLMVLNNCAESSDATKETLIPLEFFTVDDFKGLLHLIDTLENNDPTEKPGILTPKRILSFLRLHDFLHFSPELLNALQSLLKKTFEDPLIIKTFLSETDRTLIKEIFDIMERIHLDMHSVTSSFSTTLKN